MNKEEILYKWLHYLSILLCVINVWLLFAIIISALVSENYGHYTFTQILLSPETINVFIFSTLSVLFFIVETTIKFTNKLIYKIFVITTFVILAIAPIIAFVGNLVI